MSTCCCWTTGPMCCRNRAQQPSVGHYVYTPNPLTEEQVRQIIREEFAKVGAKLERGR